MKLKTNTEAFKLELKNRFSALEGLTEEIDISEANENIVKTIVETAREIGGVTCRKQNSKLSEKTKHLMKLRRYMKVDNRNTSSRIEYIELCKALRKSMKEDIRKFNCGLVRKAIENNKSLKITDKLPLTSLDVKGSLSVGKKHIIALKGEDGTVIRNREDFLFVCFLVLRLKDYSGHAAPGPTVFRGIRTS